MSYLFSNISTEFLILVIYFCFKIYIQLFIESSSLIVSFILLNIS